MDFSRLQSLPDQLSSSNQTITNLPSTILELVVPGYSTISQLAFRFFGIDIGVLVTGWVLIFGIRAAWTYTYDYITTYLSEHYTSSIRIDDDDGPFEYVTEWLSSQTPTKPSRKLKAVTSYKDKSSHADEPEYEIHPDGTVYRYEVPVPRYELTYGVDNDFRHGGRSFKVVRTSQVDEARGRMKDTLEISCYGKTTQPVKELLLDIRRWKMERETAMTSVYRPLSGGYWSRYSQRPSRSLGTVSLDREQKERVVEDVNEYLHPATARWYAARGIPHRRGYLFHGPPGTGKTSLSFALAGVFGLAIYCVSLNDKDLTESDLSSLFEDLPDRCIVLLEDIDSAGLKREEEPAAAPTTDASSPSAPADAPKTVPKPPDMSSGGGISLSALLNVIDGAAAHEGHVLIMTTNTPQSLDAALIRPGRVDLQVRFTLASRAQIRETFLRMYSATPEEQAMPTTTEGRHATTGAIGAGKQTTTHAATLERMADEFARQLPEGELSPAEVQGYLLTRKKEPERAVGEVVGWRDGVLEARRKGGRLVGAG